MTYYVHKDNTVRLPNIFHSPIASDKHFPRQTQVLIDAPFFTRTSDCTAGHQVVATVIFHYSSLFFPIVLDY